MHELALAKSLMDVIDETARTHGASKVMGALLEVGELAAIDAEALAFAFSVVSKGTIAEGCQIECRHVPLIVSCDACGNQGSAGLEDLCCPSCGSTPVRVVSGRQMRILSVDLE